VPEELQAVKSATTKSRLKIFFIQMFSKVNQKDELKTKVWISPEIQ
jgi:hypothetical protein